MERNYKVDEVDQPSGNPSQNESDCVQDVASGAETVVVYHKVCFAKAIDSIPGGYTIYAKAHTAG